MANSKNQKIDKELKSMEKVLKKIYERSNEDIEAKLKKYLNNFKKQDAMKLKMVEEGKLSEEEYTQWRIGKTLYSKEFKKAKKAITDKYAEVDKIAMAYINGKLPKAYTTGYNSVEGDTSDIKGYTFHLTDENTVKGLSTKKKTLLPYKTIDKKKEERWNTKKVNAEVLQGIIQGESIPKIAKRLERVTAMNRRSAIRNARTSITSAENKGRLNGYIQAEKDGVEMQKRWVSTNDDRTRDTHAMMDGETVPIDEPFSNGLMYPGDPNGDPAEVYNCRCTMVVEIKGFKK